MIDATPPPAGPASRPRHIKTDGPFLWLSKAAIRRVRDAFDDTTFLDQANAVYMSLCELASDAQSETFTARKRTIAERSGVSLRRVGDILDIFKATGLVTWTQNRSTGTKELLPSTYTLLGLCIPDTTSGTDSTRLCREAKRENCRESEECTEQRSEESIEHSLSEIWEAYPKKVAKPAALKAIAKALKKIGAEDLIRHVKAFAAKCATERTEARYIPHAARWFNDERWNDANGNPPSDLKVEESGWSIVINGTKYEMFGAGPKDKNSPEYKVWEEWYNRSKP
jgi:hypothetical protein